MTPEYTSDVISGNRNIGRTTGSSHKHHRRGKTGRQRKKRKHWGYFSRWGTPGESEDEDDIELYQWSKSRGLTSRNHSFSSSETTKSGPSSSRNKASNSNVSSKNSMTHRTGKIHNSSSCNNNTNTSFENTRRPASTGAAEAVQEKIFFTQLCSSIENKKRFVDQSQMKNTGDTFKVTKPATESSSPFPKNNLPRSGYSTRSFNTDVIRKDQARESPTSNRKKSSSSRQTIDTKSEYSSRDSSISRSTISLDNVTYDANGRKVIQQPGLISDKVTSPPILKKTWCANVESDILRLYKSGCDVSATDTSTSLVSSWASAGNQKENRRRRPAKHDLSSNISQSIEKKLENTEQTPSYVQSLAKILKCRVQMRKEREQILEQNIKKLEQLKNGITHERVESNNRNTEVDVFDSSINAGVLQPEESSSTHLRYRHIEDNLPRVVGGSQFQGESTRFSPTHSFSSQYSYLHPLQSISIKTRNNVNTKLSKDKNWGPAKVATERKRSDVKPHFNSRSISPEDRRTRLPDFTWDNVAPITFNNEKELDMWNRDHVDSSEILIQSITKRLEKEARSSENDTLAYRLGSSSERQTAKLQKPAQMLYTADGVRNPAYTVSKTARMCLESNSRLKANLGDENIAKQRKADLSAMSVQKPLEVKSVRSGPNMQLRWPASAGSLYIRPPGKSLIKTPAQKA